jgi:general secretion pathway protein A
MYTQHFGLYKAVFEGGIAQNDDLFLGQRQQRVAANLKIGLTMRDAVVALTGPLGVGKTTIASEALRITSTRMAQTWVGNTRLVPDEILELLLAGFELEPFQMGRVQRIHTWRQFMGEMSVTDTPICILVENALGLGSEGLQALEALTAADPNDCPGANLVLMGPGKLHELLEEPGLEPLKQRIRSRQRLDPMTPDEVEQYLRHRVAYAGGDFDRIFAPGAAAIVHCFSAGIPRLINNVCETALTVAARRKLAQVSPEIVQRVAESVYSLTPSVQIPEPPVAAAPEPVDAPVAPVEQANDEPVAEPVPEAVPVPAAEQPTHEPMAESVPLAAVNAAPEQPTEEPVLVKPAPVEVSAESAEAPVDAPVPAEPEAPPADVHALVDETEVPMEDGEARAAHAEAELPDNPVVSGTDNSAVHRAEPPVLTEAVVDDAQALEAALASITTESVEDPSEPPVLTDEVDFDLPIEIENVAADAQPEEATLPPDAPELPEEAQQADEDFSEDFAAATHLHEISDEMAEMLFSADPETSATGVFKAAVPLDTDDLDLTPGGAAVVHQVDDDGLPKSEDDQTEPEPAAARTVVY